MHAMVILVHVHTVLKVCTNSSYFSILWQLFFQRIDVLQQHTPTAEQTSTTRFIHVHLVCIAATTLAYTTRVIQHAAMGQSVTLAMVKAAAVVPLATAKTCTSAAMENFTLFTLTEGLVVVQSTTTPTLQHVAMVH